MTRERKRIDSLIGKGRLRSSQGPSVEVEYELRTYQEFVDDRPAGVGADGAVMTLDPKPWIPAGEELVLELEDGRQVTVVNKEPFTTDEWCLVEVRGDLST